MHAINGTPVTAEAAATQLASKTGDRLSLKLRAPPGSTFVEFDKPDPDTEVHDAPAATPTARAPAAPPRRPRGPIPRRGQLRV